MTNYCRDLVRNNNYNRYLLSFFAPRALRKDIIAVFALHTELESIPAKITDPAAALIRLQWWRDSLDLVYTQKPLPHSPVLAEIARTVKQHPQIPHTDFEKLFDCFESILRGTPSDPDQYMYDICGKIITNTKALDRFSKALHHHDCMDEHIRFRALRLWLGI